VFTLCMQDIHIVCSVWPRMQLQEGVQSSRCRADELRQGALVRAWRCSFHNRVAGTLLNNAVNYNLV
jgi:hypothetical protein